MPRSVFLRVFLAALLGFGLGQSRAQTPPLLAGIAYDIAAPLAPTRKPLFDPKSPPPVRMYAVTYRGADREMVPAVLTLPENPKPAPCILLLHGMGGNKQQMFLFFGLLAQRGYASLSIDLAGHGDRPKIHGKGVSDLAPAELRELLARSVVDLRRGVDYLRDCPEIDQSRIGVVGISLGGMIGGVLAPIEPRIKGAALLAAGGDWATLVATSQHEFARKFRARAAFDPVALGALLADVDPKNVIAGMAGRPLMLLNGDKDAIVPAACTDALFAAAREPKTRIVLPGGHVPDLPTLAARTLAWLDAHIKK